MCAIMNGAERMSKTTRLSLVRNHQNNSPPFLRGRFGGPFRPKTYRVVHVEDDPADHMLLRRYLSGFTQIHFEFVFIDDYGEALQRLESECFDVGLIDYELKGHSGVSLIAELGGRVCQTPLILLTGRGDRQVDIEATDAGAFDYLDKATVSPVLLERAIRNARAQFETERQLRQNETLLRHARNAAEQANKAKSDFLARVSHDLRTPLNAILGFSEIMKDQILGPLESKQYLGYAGDIHRSGAAMNAMIDELLDLSRIESGTLELREDQISIEDVAAAALKLMKPSVDHAGLTLRADIAPDMPELRADRKMVDRMLLNLLSNSVKFTPKGGKILLQAEADKDGLYLIVEDSGTGIAPGDIDRIIKPFHQGQGDEDDGLGVGLGLDIVRALVDLHGGTLQFDKALRTGARAVLAFPLDRVRRPPQ